jgi:septum formation inhibitor-activating ATPase MinD
MLVSSQKSEVGKTVIALKAGIEFSKKNLNVLLVDLSFGKKKMSEYLDVNEDIIYDVKDVLDDTCSINQGLLNINEKLSLLPFPRIPDKLGVLEKRSLSKLLEQAREKYDIIILDLNFENYFTCLDQINSIVIVNNNDFSSVNNINNLINTANEFNIENQFVVLNKYNKKEAKKGNMITQNNIKKLIECDIEGVIEIDPDYENFNYDYLISEQNNSFNSVLKNIMNKLSTVANF